MNVPSMPPFASSRLLFVRHGATAPNLDGLRCGGDLDLPLTDRGRAQVAQVARTMRASGQPIDLIVASDLLRTRESADIIAALLGDVPIEIDALWRERALGSWNLRPIAENEHALRAGLLPPGGESNAAFSARIGRALERLLEHPQARSPLLVGSKGVARVLGELLGAQPDAPVPNAGLLCFDLSAEPARASEIAS